MIYIYKDAQPKPPLQRKPANTHNDLHNSSSYPEYNPVE